MSLRSFHGYRVAAVAALAFAASAPGQTFVVSQFNLSLRGALGIGETELATAYMAATILAAFPLVVVGRLADRLGPRRSLALIATVFGLVCVAFGTLVHGLATLFLGFFLIRFLGQGGLTLVSAHAVALWFHRRLGVVGGVKTVVVFLLWALLPPAVLTLINGIGWRATYGILGVGVIATVVPAALAFVRDRPEDVGQHLDGGAPAQEDLDMGAEPSFTLVQARRTPAYWILAAALVLSPLIGTALLFSLQPLALAVGLGVGVAASASSAWSWTMAVLALPSGWLVDRAWPGVLLCAGLSAMSVSCAMFTRVDAAPLFILGMVGYGASQSLIAATAPAALARYFGRAHHGAIRASVSRYGIVGAGIGPMILGVSQDFLGGYAAGLWVLSLICVPAAILSLMLRAPALAA